MRTDGRMAPNVAFGDPAGMLAELATVTPPPPGATTLVCGSRADVAGARRLVRVLGAQVGLDPDVVDDVALSVTEVLANALVHGEPPALLHVYDEGDTWVCHVHDTGRTPVSPLSGVLPPSEPSDHGYGLWLARQLCTAVDVGHRLLRHARAAAHAHPPCCLACVLGAGPARRRHRGQGHLGHAGAEHAQHLAEGSYVDRGRHGRQYPAPRIPDIRAVSPAAP